MSTAGGCAVSRCTSQSSNCLNFGMFYKSVSYAAYQSIRGGQSQQRPELPV